MTIELSLKFTARLFTGIAMAVAVSAAPASAQRIEAIAAVDTRSTGPVIEPAVYGQFAEHLGRSVYEGIWVGENSPIPNTRGYRNDVLNALRKIKVPVIRWPGGCFADEYHWRDGIGPRDKRPVRINTHWGWVPEDNAFGTHEFMDFTELLGAEAYIAGNMGSSPPQEMANWVEYMTSDLPTTLANERRANGRAKPWKVKYFGVGNETWGCGGHMTPEYSADLHKRYQTFVKAPGHSPIIKVASGANGDNENWTEVMLARSKDQMNAISLHYYTLPTGDWGKKGPATGFDESAWAATLNRAIFLDDIITRHSKIMDKYDPEKKIALYVDEWGTWYDEEPGTKGGFLYQQSSLRDAHVAALTLNIFHRHTDRVKLATIAQMVNVLQAMVLTDGPRMLLTPTYHVFDMYQPFQGATPLRASVNGPDYKYGDVTIPTVDVSAARGTDGKLYLALVNSDPNNSARLTTSIAGVSAKGATGRIITGPAMDTHNTFDKPNRIQPAPYRGKVSGGKLVFDLPSKSVVVVQVQ
ncbi:MAG: alpha-N-arabinofuranosidase [Pseudomonadota bacterium]|nr:alpha-N-arabinofuranosidase [Pseudomonadota bacterium]